MSLRISGRVLPTSIRLNITPNAVPATVIWLPNTGVDDLGNGIVSLQGGLRAASATPALPSSGNWYYEITQTSGAHPLIGLGTPAPASAVYPGSYPISGGYFLTDGSLYVNGGTKITTSSNTGGGTLWTDPIGVAYTASTRTVQFYRNNVMVGSLSIGGTATLHPSVGNGNNGPTGVFSLNIGAAAFTNPIPVGFTALGLAP